MAEKTGIRTDATLKNGAHVQVLSHVYPDYNGEYLYERQATIPPGSVGKIIYVDADIYVKFDGLSSEAWSRQWRGAADYWKGGRRNVAYYRPEELRPVDLPTKTQIQVLKAELQKLHDTFRPFATPNEDSP